MNAKALIPLVAGLGIGGLALKLGISTLQNAKAGQTTAKAKLWAAKEDIPRGTQIREEMLQAVAFPAEVVPPGAFKDKDKLVGRVPRLVAPAGLPILETMLAPPDTPAGIYVKPGLRAVAVKIDASSGVDYHLEPGSRVDVAGSFKVRKEGRVETMARTIIENAEVAAVGQRLSPVSGKEVEEKEKDKERQVRAITLFVQPDQVKKLLLAEQQGPIKLSLRGNDDVQVLNDNRTMSDLELQGNQSGGDGEETAGKSPAFEWLRGLFAKPQPAPAPEPVLVERPEPALQHWILKIYRGQNAETVQFKDRDSRERVDASESDEPALFGTTRHGKTSTKKPPVDNPEPASTQENQEPGTEPQERTE
jgi:pilus assembly protein CpaB